MVINQNSLQNYLSFYFNLYGFRGGDLHTYILEGFAMSSQLKQIKEMLTKFSNSFTSPYLQKLLTLKQIPLYIRGFQLFFKAINFYLYS
jgi:hypothetical protein